MSNSSPTDASPPDSKAAPGKAIFQFAAGDDSQLRYFDETRQQRQAASRPSQSERDVVTISTDPTVTSTSSDSANYALLPVVSGDVHQAPAPAGVLTEKGNEELEDAADKKESDSDPSHLAIELESPPAKETSELGRQDLFLPAQDLNMTVRFMRKSSVAFWLYVVGCILSVGILYLICSFWAPKLYRKLVYRFRAAPTEAELLRGEKVSCLVKIPSEPATVEPLQLHQLPTPVPSNKIFTPNMRIPFRNQAEIPQGISRSRLTHASDSNTLSQFHLLNFRHTPLIYHGPSQKLVNFAEWRDTDIDAANGGVTPLSTEQVALRKSLFGQNLIDVKGQPLHKLIVEECLHPFYVFTLASCGLWFYDTYEIYAAVVLAISILGIASTVIQAYRSQNRLRNLSRFQLDVEVLRVEAAAQGVEKPSASWNHLPSTELVPGDIVSVSDLVSQSLPADMLLLTGSNVIVNESMLTGESTPSSKNPTPSRTLDEFARGDKDISDVEKNLLWGGTTLLRASSEEENGKATAIVVSTAWNSSKGSLIKMMLFPKPINFAFYKDAFLFILILVMICVTGFIGSVINFVIVGVDGGEIGLRTIDLFTICVPPALPAAMSLCTTFALRRLRNASIFCISPQRITVAGKVSIAVFDKTGTLTESGLDVRGVRVPAAGGNLADMRESIEDMNETARKDGATMEEAMAVTHDVNFIDGEALGDPLEVSMLLFTKWVSEPSKRALQGDEASGHVQCISSPARQEAPVAVLRKFDFHPGLRRMSVITQSPDREGSTIYVKGAPEAIVPLCDPATIPDDFDAILNDATRKGLRVLAFGHKTVSLSWQGAQRCPRGFAEGHLDFLGLLFFENKLKETTAAAIAELHEADIPTKMCTGDAVNTAIAVAREAGIIPVGQPVFVPRLPECFKADKSLGGTSNPAALVWTDIDMPLQDEEQSVAAKDGGLDPYSLSPRDPALSLSTVGLALTGNVFEHLLNHASQETIARLLVRAQVFARFSPELKAELVERLQAIGHTVAFVGDGANDTGALKGADVGLSLSDAEASVAAPFTSGSEDITSLLALIKEGRNCLSTSTSLFLYFGSYAITEFYSVILLFGQTASWSNADYLYVDIGQVFAVAIGMAYGKPAAVLSKSRPFSRLLTRRVVLSLLGNILFIIVAITVPYVVLHKQEWYERPEFDPEELSLENQDNTVVSKTAFFTFTITAIAWSIGPPHRQILYRNWVLSLSILVLGTLNLAILFSNSESNSMLTTFGNQVLPWSFIFIIFGTVLVQALCTFLWEFLLLDIVCRKIERPVKRWQSWRFRGENVNVEKKYRSVERALKHEEAQRAQTIRESAAPVASR